MGVLSGFMQFHLIKEAFGHPELECCQKFFKIPVIFGFPTVKKIEIEKLVLQKSEKRRFTIAKLINTIKTMLLLFGRFLIYATTTISN